jgi:hypothetical protein
LPPCPQEPRRSSGRVDAATGTSWFSPENFSDLGQDAFMSMFFPTG